MLVPLVVLAILSLIGGWVGWPASLGGSDHFGKFLAPVFRVTTPAINVHSLPGEAVPAAEETEGAEARTRYGTEREFTGISLVTGLLGLLLAWQLYLRRPELPARIAASVHGLYSAVRNKYWIDELYDRLFVKPLIAISGTVFWRGIDQGIIDRSLDGSAAGARELSDEVRHMESGNVRSYAGWVAIGAAGVIAYMLWVGLRAQ
jgi:NADH-quinone oxidoreductase subunit L